MKFLTTGEKVRRLRTQLKLNQEDLQTENVTRGLISMIETGRRDVTYKTAVKLVEKFNEKAEELDIISNIDEAYLMRSPKEDAEVYCLNKLMNTEIERSRIDEIFQIANEYELIEVRAKAYCSLGEIYFKEKEFEIACDIYKKAREIYIGINKNEQLGYVYWKLGFCKAEALKYDAAIEYYQISLYYCLEYKDSKTKKLCLYSLANSYKKSNQINLALETVDEFLSVCNEEEDFRLYIFAYVIKATCYEVKKDYDKVIDIYKEALLKVSDDKNIFLGYAYNNLARAYAGKNDFKESIKYFEMAEKFRNDIDKANLAATLIEKSEVLLKQNLIDEAIKSIELGIKYAKEYKYLEYLLKGDYLLGKIYDKIKDNENLEKVYLEIIELVKNTENNDKLKTIYNELAIMYLNQNKIDMCKKYLSLSKKLN
ncbi:helix-turn-helix transcriptional regulator [Clostridium akagii]|uniref:helix-turn-helix transcriptional regulator n=1 Tax=Clostridium akagii TaxID=91623 RepID=UPI00047D8F37|nr:helix-turn-helix transcriptional regulator [Clostridium akagii]